MARNLSVVLVTLAVIASPLFARPHVTRSAVRLPSRPVSQRRSRPAPKTQRVSARHAQTHSSKTRSSDTSKTAAKTARFARGSRGRQLARAGKAASRSRWRSESERAPARPSWASGSPTQDRYREIQQALADRGYYKGAVDGQWNSESVEALRRFEADQKLEADGKIGSLALIALGLGPRRAVAAQESQKLDARSLQ